MNKHDIDLQTEYDIIRLTVENPKDRATLLLVARRCYKLGYMYGQTELKNRLLARLEEECTQQMRK